jgi:hypothetical protein
LLGTLPKSALDEIPFQPAETVNEQGAVEMIDLMLEHHGQ